MLLTIVQNWGALGFSEIASLVIGYAALILVMLPVHELAHAFVADKLGDNTARWHGRLRLNPFVHLDPIGTTMLVLFGYGYAKPVPVNPRNFRNVKAGIALTALAGPLSNLAMAAISLGIFSVIWNLELYWFMPYELFVFLNWLLVYVFAGVNIGLAVFNLLPIPPLDGSRVLNYFLPGRWLYMVERYSQYITWILLFLIFSGTLDTPLDFLRSGIGNLLCKLVGLPSIF